MTKLLHDTTFTSATGRTYRIDRNGVAYRLHPQDEDRGVHPPVVSSMPTDPPEADMPPPRADRIARLDDLMASFTSKET